MGIDIYAYAERRQPDGSWALASGTRTNYDLFFGDDEHYSESEEGIKPWPPLVPAEAFEMVRNYELFAILADVTNGIRTANEAHFEYISQPRGLPEDLSPELREYADLWEESFRSPTWLLLEEILTFPWKEKIILREAMVDARVAHLFGYKRPFFPWQELQPPATPRSGFPLTEWPIGVSVSYAVYMRDGVTVQWMETYEEIARDFFDLLKPLQALGDAADTRLVFWFD